MPELVSTLRRSLVTLRYRRIGPAIGGPEAAWRGHWTAIVLASVLVFAGFVAIGRLTRGSGSATSEATRGAPSALGGATEGAAVPAELSGGSPVAASTPVAIAARPRPRRAHAAARPHVVAPVVSALPAASAVGVRAASAATPTPAAAAPVLSGATRTPNAPAPGAGAGGGGATAPPTRSTKPSGPAAGGGSFDSSE